MGIWVTLAMLQLSKALNEMNEALVTAIAMEVNEVNLANYLALFPAFSREKPRFAALAEAVLRQVTDLIALVLQLASGFSFALAEGVQLDALGESVSVPRQEGWDDETYRSILLRKLKLNTWDGTNETSFSFVEDGETFIDNCDGTVTAASSLPLPAGEVLPVPTGVKSI